MLPEKAFQPRNGRHGMTLEGGGGGGSQPTQTSQITIPEYMQPYAEAMIGQAGALTGISPSGEPGAGYQPYGGERLAGVTDEQLAARSGMSGYAGPQQFAPATGFATAGAESALQSADYQAGQFAPGQVTSGLSSFAIPGMADMYMSPYMQAVTDVQKQAATREAQLAQRQANLASGARTGALGSSGQILAQAERERGLLDRLSNIQATGSQAAYEQAQRAFEQEQGRGLQAGLQTQQQQLEAQRLGEQSRQFGANLGMQGAQTALQAASTLGQLGATEQASTLDRLRAQEEFGRLEQERQQQALDIAYQDFLNQQRFPYQQLDYFSGLLRGLPGQSQTMYQAEPSTLSQVAGGGLGLLGLSKLLGS